MVIHPIPILPIDDECIVTHDAARESNGYGQFVPPAYYYYHSVYGFRNDIWGQVENEGLISCIRNRRDY